MTSKRGASDLAVDFHATCPFSVVLLSEVSQRGWREGVGDKQCQKYSKKCPPKLRSPTHKGA